jgi:hypothetical protein
MLISFTDMFNEFIYFIVGFFVSIHWVIVAVVWATVEDWLKTYRNWKKEQTQ